MELAAISNEKIKVLGIETLKINSKDTIIISVDTKIWDIDEISSIIKIFRKTFPQNTVIAKLNGIEIEKQADKSY